MGARKYCSKAIFAHWIDLVSHLNTEIHSAALGPKLAYKQQPAQNPFALAVTPPSSPFQYCQNARVLPCAPGCNPSCTHRSSTRLHHLSGSTYRCETLRGNRLVKCMRVNLVRRRRAARALTYRAAVSLACGKGCATLCIACGSDVTDRWQQWYERLACRVRTHLNFKRSLLARFSPLWCQLSCQIWFE